MVENVGLLLLFFVFIVSCDRVMSVDDWVVLDCVLYVVMFNGVVRVVFVGQGKVLICFVGSVFKEIVIDVVVMWVSVMVKFVRVFGYYVVVVGCLLGLLGVDVVIVQWVYLYFMLCDVLFVVMRLNFVGFMEVVLLQYCYVQFVECVMGKYVGWNVYEVYQFVFVFDIL